MGLGLALDAPAPGRSQRAGYALPRRRPGGRQNAFRFNVFGVGLPLHPLYPLLERKGCGYEGRRLTKPTGTERSHFTHTIFDRIRRYRGCTDRKASVCIRLAARERCRPAHIGSRWNQPEFSRGPEAHPDAHRARVHLHFQDRALSPDQSGRLPEAGAHRAPARGLYRGRGRELDRGPYRGP